MPVAQNETLTNLFTDLGISTDYTSTSLERLMAADSRFIKDLKLNVSTTLGSSNFTKKEAYLLALSTAINEKQETLVAAFEELAKKEGASDAEIAEIHACTSLMNANNVFYRFRHFMAGVEYYEKTPAGIRMSIMANPVLGKEFFELVSLSVSALNGCEMCVTSHESSVRNHGASEARVYDTIRLAAVIRSLSAVL